MTPEPVKLNAALAATAEDPYKSPLGVLVSLEREVRDADSIDQIGFIAVNRTRRLVDYFQCVLWQVNAAGKARVRTVSGISDFDRHSQALVSLERVIEALHDTKPEMTRITAADIPADLQTDWREWLPEHGLWCPFKRPSGEVYGGLMLHRAVAFAPGEIDLIDPLVDAYSHAWHALDPGKTSAGSVRVVRKRWMQVVVLLLLTAALAIPVRESALAPGEIVAYQPLLVSAPVRGVIHKFHIRPNEPVAAGQLLFSMDDTEFKSRYEIAEKSYEVAVADYRRAEQKSFSDQQSKSELALFKARAEHKQLERDYALTLLQQTKVHAERDGVAVFADSNEWIGQPVEVGQKILTLADPKDAELQIWLAMEDGINLEPGSDVQMFLNTDPTSPLRARIRQTSYAPEKTLEGNLAFRLKAGLDPEQAAPRIGLKGTAKVYGDEVALFYYIMRRPLSVLRQKLGI